MEDKYYIIDYDYNHKLKQNKFFIHELIPNQDFNFFIRDIEFTELEYLAQNSWDGIYPYCGAMFQYIPINKKQNARIHDLNLIKGYYTDIKEAEKDLEKLIDFIEKSKEKYIF